MGSQLDPVILPSLVTRLESTVTSELPFHCPPRTWPAHLRTTQAPGATLWHTLTFVKAPSPPVTALGLCTLG